MVKSINIEQFISDRAQLPLVDVRSLREFQKGHIPSAVNIPLFSDDERAHVGTVYKKKSKDDAIALAYKYVSPKLESFVTQAHRVAPEGKIVVHCWRGGMRSQAFAKHLEDNGFSDVSVIEGGYKSYRRYTLNNFAKPYKLMVVGGYTGSGKTYLLHHLRQLGHQIIDLEELANHRGSAFGFMSQQPTVEQFENNLHDELLNLDANKPIWLEDESHSIGKVFIPIDFFNQIRSNPIFFLEIPRDERVKLLVRDYGGMPKEFLSGAINKISKRLGGEAASFALELLQKDDFHQVAHIALQYYDKNYRGGLEQRSNDKVYTLKCDGTNPEVNAQLIINKLNEYAGI